MEPHQDRDGNLYDLGFGLNWNCIIINDREENYKIKFKLKNIRNLKS